MEYNISQRWKDDYDLLEIEYGDGHWYAVFAKREDITGSAYNRTSDLIEMEYQIKQRWDENMGSAKCRLGRGRKIRGI